MKDEADFDCTDCEDTGEIEQELPCDRDGVRYIYRPCACNANDADSDLESRLDAAINRAQDRFEARLTEVSL